MISNIYSTIVKGNQKAIVGFVITFITGLGLQVGGVNILDVTVGEIISAGVTGAIASAGVWLKANNK